MQITKRLAGNGLQWIKCGWELFKPYVGLWIIITIAVTLLVIFLSLLPLLGGILSSLISPLIAAGMLNGAANIRSGDSLDANQILEPIKSDRRNALLTLGAVQLAVTILAGLVMLSFINPAVLEAMRTGGSSVNNPLGGLPITGVLISMLLWLLFLMAMLYAPALVWFDGVKPVEALRESFRASWQNMLPLSLYGAIMLVLAILAAIPFGLGYLILSPVAVCSLYCSYRDIFHAEPKEHPAVLKL